MYIQIMTTFSLACVDCWLAHTIERLKNSIVHAYFGYFTYDVLSIENNQGWCGCEDASRLRGGLLFDEIFRQILLVRNLPKAETTVPKVQMAPESNRPHPLHRVAR